MEIELNDQNFEAEVLKSKLPVLVDFFAVWCGPCQMMAPSIAEIAKEQEGKVRIGKIDVDQSPLAAEKYGIMSVPTMILFKEGLVIKTLQGFMGKEEILREIELISK